MFVELIGYYFMLMCSSFLLNGTVKLLVEKRVTCECAVLESFLRDLYVDDTGTSFSFIDDASNFYRIMNSVMTRLILISESGTPIMKKLNNEFVMVILNSQRTMKLEKFWVLIGTFLMMNLKNCHYSYLQPNKIS